MKSTVETLSPTRVRLAIEVPFDELKPSLQKAYRDIGSQVQIPGFRRGKIPAAVIDQRVGRGAVLNEAVQEVIPRQILAAVREHDRNALGGRFHESTLNSRKRVARGAAHGSVLSPQEFLSLC